MLFITLCPNCRTMQQAGRACTICRYPVKVPRDPQDPKEPEPKEAGHETPRMRSE